MQQSQYWQKVFLRRVSRRRMLKGVALGGLGITAAAALGCREDEAAVQSPATSTATSAVQATATAAADQPRYGGILRAISGEPPNYDLHQNSTVDVAARIGPAYNSLVQWNPLTDKLEIVADLARSWEQPDSTTVIFHLNSDVKFHHGKVLDSEDVKINLDRVRQPPEGVVSPRQGDLAPIDRIETPDSLTVKIVTKWPWAAGFGNLATGWNAIFPKDILAQKGHMKEDVVGTGAYKFKQHIKGTSIELVKNPDFFVPERPYLDGIKFFIIPDPVNAFAAFRAHEIDIAGLSHDNFKFVKENMSDQITTKLGLGWLFFVVEMATWREPWNDPRVWRALSLALDRPVGIDVVEDGDGRVGSTLHPEEGWAMPVDELTSIPGFGSNIAENLGRAKQLLSEAGFPVGIKATGMTRDAGGYREFALYVIDQYKKVGIDLDVTFLETATFYERANAHDFGDIFPQMIATASGDPDAIFGQKWISGAIRNYSRLSFPEVDELFIKQSQELNVEARRKLVQQMDKAQMENYPLSMAWWRPTRTAYWNNVRNYFIHPGLGNSYNNTKHVHTWLAS